MRRRDVLAGGVAVGLAGVGGPSVAEAMTPAGVGRLAYLYCLPLQEMAATRAKAIGQGVNQLRHARVLANAQSRAVTTPNCDTLYSSAWLDLSKPVTIHLPDAGGRYFSLALMDLYTNNFRVLGDRRREGFSRAILVGPDWREPTEPGVAVIRSPTISVWALARTYVAAPSELDAAHVVQDHLTLEADTAGPFQTLVPAISRDDIQGVFRAANRIMARDPPPHRDSKMLKSLAKIGVGPGLVYPADRLSDLDQRQVEAGARSALEELKSGHDGAGAMGGWIYPKADQGDFGLDYGYRASVALGGLAALPAHEAIYLRGVGERNGLYDGATPHVLRLRPGDFARRDGFWSLTLYGQTPDGQLFFFDNPQNRYAISGATPGLVALPDGLVEITIAQTPAPGAEANWLPCPDGPYRLQFRAFRPTEALTRGKVRLAPVHPFTA